jgi:pyridoxamine 5'-phosphate oxidase
MLSGTELREDLVPADPLPLFLSWLEAARAADPNIDPTAMTLATASPEGRPSARLVLLKGADADGFRFFTNYSSRKGLELARNPHAALTFFWPRMERQVRVEGTVVRLDEAESDAYFESRPAGSRWSAAASPQSQVVPDRATLEQLVRELQTERNGDPPARPAGWGGYRVIPDSIEFWQGRADRLHDRLRYTREAGSWSFERLAP